MQDVSDIKRCLNERNQDVWFKKHFLGEIHEAS